MYRINFSGLKPHHKLQIALTGLLVFSSALSHADNSNLHGSLEAQYSQDSDKAKDKSIFLDAGISTNSSLLLTAGNSSSPAAAGGIDLVVEIDVPPEYVSGCRVVVTVQFAKDDR